MGDIALESSAIIIGDVFARHRVPRGHPETSERILVLMRELRGVARWVKPRPADPGEIMLVHEEEYVSLVKSYSELGTTGQLDPDTFVSEGTWDAARHAVGAAVQAALLAYSGSLETVFAAVRPPGHHAHPSHGAGFCIFNNVAVAASKLLAQRLVSRIAVVDVDAHYGDGTAHIFYDDPSVLYVSLHGDPREYYPWKGFPEELGAGEGRGYNIPVPLPPGVGDDGYLEAVESIVVPVLEEYRPELVLVSAGFDTHHGDPLMDFMLTVQGHWRVARELYLAAKRVSGRGVAGVLEGGYNLNALPKSTANFLAAYLEKPLYREKSIVPGRAARRLGEYIGRVRRVLSKYWSL
jgi:acetoin utilization deacetylase AcuC-like enzyme